MTPAGAMRALLRSRLLRAGRTQPPLLTATNRQPIPSSPTTCDPILCQQNCRCFAEVKGIESLDREVWFTSSEPPLQPFPPSTAGNDHQPPDERTLQLGKTVRTLHERLPTLLLSPLPSEVLSPQISLHLFPSTHPHLPTVSGRIGYIAALWTAPVAWGRVPLVGNVKLTILSERMVKNGGNGNASRSASKDEKLIVRWKTCGKTKHRDGTGGVYRGVGISAKDPVDRIKEFISGGKDDATAGRAAADEAEEEFCGIFVFEFDGEGKIVKHVIEHTDEGGYYDKMTRVVSVTDWLLGHFNGKGKQNVPELAFCEERPHGRAIHMADRSQRWH